VPTPMSETLQSDQVGEILHFDYMYMGPSQSGEMYWLILKDDAASYIWLIACKRADTETTVRALMNGLRLLEYRLFGCLTKGRILRMRSSWLGTASYALLLAYIHTQGKWNC
jgi:hypothetical protein